MENGRLWNMKKTGNNCFLNWIKLKKAIAYIPLKLFSQTKWVTQENMNQASFINVFTFYNTVFNALFPTINYI